MTKEIAVNITQQAVDKAKELVSLDGSSIGLRIEIKKGGCSGMTYDVVHTKSFNEQDEVIKKDNNVDIMMTLTTPNCPEAQTIPEKVADVVSLLKGVNEVKVEITWDPPWTQDNMTDAAKLELGLM